MTTPQQEPVALPFRKSLERLLDEAEHPKGMSVHDGKAHVPADWIRYLLKRLDMSAPPAAPVDLIKTPLQQAQESYEKAAPAATDAQITYVMKGDQSKTRFRQLAKDPIPPWAHDVQPYTEPAVTDERKAFEAWYDSLPLESKILPTHPLSAAERFAYMGWQASASRRRVTDAQIEECKRLADEYRGAPTDKYEYDFGCVPNLEKVKARTALHKALEGLK